MSSENATNAAPVHGIVMPRVQVTNPFCGLIHMQVCAVPDATDEEILEVCNRENVCGTTLGWAKVIREPDGDIGENPEAAPVPCEEHEGRVHFLVSC